MEMIIDQVKKLSIAQSKVGTQGRRGKETAQYTGSL